MSLPGHTATIPEAAETPPGASRPSRRGWVIALALIWLLALGLRLGVMAQGHGLPEFDTPLLDARYYVESGLAIASWENPPAPPFFMSPGYAGFVALMARLFGDPLASVRLAQVVIDALTCVLTALLGAALFGRPAGLLAGILLAVHGPMILASTRVLPETLATFLLAALALVLSRFRDRVTRTASVAAGLLLGAVALLRANVILFLPLLLAGLVLRAGASPAAGPREARREGALKAAAALAGFLAIVLPITLTNLVAGHDLVLISTNGGVNFLIGNAPEGDGRFISLNSLDLAPGRFRDDPAGGAFERSVHAFAEERTGRSLRPSEASSFWWIEGLSEIRRSPLAWAGLMARKVFLLVNGFELPQAENIYFLGRSVPMLRGLLSNTSRLLWPLGLAGLLLALEGREIPWSILLLVAAYSASILLFFVTARHRLPLMPFVSCFAALAFVRCVTLARARATGRLIGLLGLIGGALLVCNASPALGGAGQGAGPFEVPEDYLDFASQYNNLSTALLDRDDATGAERAAREGLELSPQDPALWFNLSCALAARHDLAGAENAIRSSLAAAPYDPAALTMSAELRYARHDLPGAKTDCETAIRIDGSYARAWGALGLALSDLGDTPAGLHAIREAIRLDPAWPDARFNLAVLLERMGRREEALGQIRRLVEENPEMGRAREFLGKLEASSPPPGE